MTDWKAFRKQSDKTLEDIANNIICGIAVATDDDREHMRQHVAQKMVAFLELKMRLHAVTPNNIAFKTYMQGYLDARYQYTVTLFPDWMPKREDVEAAFNE